MIDVKKALASTMTRVNATTPCVGPFSKLFVLRSTHKKAGRTAKARKRPYPTEVNKIQTATRPAPEFTRLTQSARSSQPTMSFTSYRRISDQVRASGLKADVVEILPLR